MTNPWTQEPRPATRPRLADAGRVAVLATLLWVGFGELGFDEVVGRQLEPTIPWAFLVGAVLGLIGAGRLVVWGASLTVGLLLLVILTPITERAARGLVRADSLPATASVDAVVVLSASVRPNGRLTWIGAERLLSGLALIREGVSNHLVVSRVWSSRRSDAVSSDADQHAIIHQSGVAPEVVLLDSVSSTRREAERLVDSVRGRGWHRIVLVTSASHTRRACATFERLGFAVTCRPSERTGLGPRRTRSSRERLTGFADWLYETLGWWKYRLKGWV